MRGWKLVFVGVAGNGESFVDRWQEKHNHHCCELHKGCLRLGISHFFFGFKPKKHLRSPLIDHWKKLNVRRVKIELYSHRKMYINRNFGGCNAAYGWFMVTENNTGCRWDYYRRPYPQFLFGKGRGVRWNSLRFENANYMGIWIQLY
ncbi:hypothetical protein KUTeg_014950 [Tegillarca granosa]|uniref:Uncharacterized protein n=1 Tax=Tegillarca granosa TaxID=220873 RepID=A0ABQ9ESD3_TEGGR|nr:hypothetical protein KUTeg_014950 [Tegillarca granosa]